MKRLLFLFAFFVHLAHAQTIDTVYVRNTQLQAGDWAYLVGKTLDKYTDSITILTLRRIRIIAQQQNPGSFATNITVDSIPGIVMINWYKMLLFASYLETRNRGTAIFNAITGNAVLTTFINEIDSNVGDLFTDQRKKGKNYLLDN